MASSRVSDPAILSDLPWIRYRIAGSIAAERPIEALRRVIHVYAGSDIDATDIEFDLMDFGDSLWIIPDEVSVGTHQAWAEHLRAVGGYFEASMSWPPKHWLDGGFLGLLRRPAAKILVGETLPPSDREWTMKGPLDPATYQPLVPANPGAILR